MKILILQDDFPPQTFGGAGFSTFSLAKGLHKAGHQVSVITACQKKADEGETNYQGLMVFRVFTNYHERWRAYFSLYNPQTVKKVKEIIGKINPDVIHANNIHCHLSYHCLKIAKQYSKAVVLTARDVMLFNDGKLATKKYLEHFNYRANWWDHLKQNRKRYNPFRNFLIKRYLKYVDKVFAVSNALKTALGQNGIKNVEVSYTGIDVGDWQVGSEKIEEFKQKHNLYGKKVIFFGGRISGLKGMAQIGQAVDRIKKELPQTVLLTAGSKSLPAGGQGAGWLSGDELKAAFACADVVVVPSVCFDSFPRSNLEAMAAQKPVVATCYGGSPEIVKDGVTGYIVNPLKVDELTNKLLDLLKNPEKAKQFGQAGYERVKKHFNLDSQVAQTISWYQKILNKKII